MRGHCGCGALSRSRRLGASSIPLEPRLSVQPCVRPMHSQCRNPHRLNTSSGASQGPLVRASICACVMMVDCELIEECGARKMSGHGARCR